MTRWILSLLFVVGLSLPASAQVTIPYPDFVAGNDILSDEVDANFNTLANQSLNRTGGTVTGNISVDTNVTVDGVDISDYLSGGGVIATGDLSVGDDASITDDVSIGGDLGVTGATFLTGAATLGSTLDLTGKLTAASATISLRGVDYTLPAALTGAGTRLLDFGSGNLGWGWSSGLSGQGSTFTTDLVTEYYIVSATATADLITCSAANAGKWVHIKNTAAAGTVTIDPAGAETIDGAATLAFSTQYASISIVCGGSGVWYIF